MSDLSSKLDYSALLASLITCEGSALPWGLPKTPVRDNFDHVEVPASEELRKAISHYCSMYEDVPNGLGSLKPIGRAKISEGNHILTTAQSWEFQAWIPFAPRRVMNLEGALLSVQLTVHDGAVDIGILAEDGTSLAGDRYRAPKGKHDIQLIIPTNEVKGLVICNCGPRAVAGDVELGKVVLRRFAPESEPAKAWRQAEISFFEKPPVETSNPADLQPTPPLCVFHLLQTRRFEDAQLLVRATKILTGTQPAWWPQRLDAFLVDYLRLSRETPTIREAIAPPPARDDEPRNALLSEWLKLNPALGGQDYVPLHFEILEAGLLLDLFGVTHEQKTKFEWHREAVASPLVRRGILTHLLRVLRERLDGNLANFSITVSSCPEVVTVRIDSDLQHGDLQYRHFSPAVVKLLQSFNSPVGKAPELKHDLGNENRLILEWKQQAEPLGLPTIVHQTDTEPATVIHLGESGSRILSRAGLCYKFSPTGNSKKLSLEQEIDLRLRVADLDVAPLIAATQKDGEGEWASSPLVDGVALSDSLDSFGDRNAQTAVIRTISDIVSLVNQRGVQHRDLRAENILITRNHDLMLIDFDQAVCDSLDDDFGNEWDEERACAGFGGLLKQLQWEGHFLKTAGRLGFAWELGRCAAANSPGKHACYYSWDWGPFALSGERPWTSRWNLLRRAFAGARGRFLELGSNLGLLATYAALEGWEATGLERDAVAVEGAKLIASALSSSADFHPIDLQDETALERWDQSYDLVSALSVIHWLPDPKPAEAFLSRQNRLLFEGHRSIAEEKKYLEGLGFTTVELLGYSERLRPVLLASKH
ncbi:MAG: hypothetical protein SynsKO_20160 [Synoicihabitans sp.]